MQAYDLSDNINTRINQIYTIAQTTWQFTNPDVMSKVATSQAILESALDQPEISGLALENNLFGIKGQGTAGTSQMNTQEEVNGRMITVSAGFAINNTLEDSFQQHKELLMHPRYQDVISATSPDDAFDALQAAGYATDDSYANELKEICVEYLG